MHGLRAAWVGVALAIGCAGASPSPDATPASPNAPASDEPDGAHAGIQPEQPEAHDDSGKLESCPDSRDAAPASWALTPSAPVPSASNWTGMWIAVSGPPSKGRVEMPEPCFEGLKVMAIEQSGSRIRAAWAIRAHAQGAVLVEWRAEREVETGTVRGGRVELDGYFITERGSRHSSKVERECQPVSYSLSYDAASEHLIGTRAGKPIRLAPLVIKPRAAGSCGPPPP